MKRTLFFAVTLFTLSGLTLGLFPSHAGAAFDKNVLIDDVVFNDYNSMSAAQVDAFLNSFPYSCISTDSGFEAKEPTGYSPSGGFTYGSFVSAGQVIVSAAKAYDLNPQVLLVTLEKEQSLVTGRNSPTYCYGTEHKYSAAVGYGCPDSGGSYSWSGVSLYRRSGVERTATGSTCVNSEAKAGFAQQVIRAAWVFKFSQQRALGNVSWAIVRGSWDNSDDLTSCYSGYMTQGTLKRCPTGSAAYYDGWASIDGVATHMDTGATASLYRYTPHFHGNQNFVALFESWFGSVLSAGYYSCGLSGANIGGAADGQRVLSNRLGRGDAPTLSLAQLNNTGSQCIEMHTWTSSMQQWVGHVATNRTAINPDDADILMADLNGDGKDELVLVEYRNTGSGQIEIHTWNASYQHWAAHIATAHPAIDPADSEVIAADRDGDGRDELYLVRYQNNGSGTVEIHGWTSNFQGYTLHSITNHSAVSPADSRVIAADADGDGKDGFFLVKYQNNGSGTVEIHGWTSNFQAWVSHMASNHSSLNPADNEVIAHDSNGDGRDEFTLVKIHNTDSGRIEMHGWTPNLQGWISHVAATR